MTEPAPAAPAPAAASTPPAWRIAVISFCVLTLELALIRQIPAEVRAISYFTNLLLMATFFGLGLGCILARARPLGWLVPLGLALLAAGVYFARGIVIYEEASAVHFWLQYKLAGTAPHLPLFPSAAAAFVLTALPFVGLGQALARAMDHHPRLRAYGWDIAGSLAGTAAFALAAYLALPPWVWIPAGVVLWAAVELRTWPARLIHVGAGALFFVFALSPHEARWSPYYYVQYKNEAVGTRVWVNSSFHQIGLDFKSEVPRYREIGAKMFKKFSRPYGIYRQHHGGRAPRRVLILGAGTGNDAYVALQNGAEQITAVEIDPVIVELGRRYNTSRPYDSPRVEVVVDDARHFLWSRKGLYDLIVFATLDSQTLLSGQANLRLENYVYTEEAFRDVRAALARGGMFAAYYSAFKPWLATRMLATARGAFGERTRLWRLPSAELFNVLLMGALDLPDFSGSAAPAGARAATDDWPFVYLERPTISPVYLKLFAVLALLIGGAFWLVRRQHRVSGLHANFLLLGLGFTLMETAAIVRLALLFGATWVTNVVVIAAFLCTILLANWMTIGERAPRLTLAWIGLFVCVGVNALVPLQPLFALGFAARAALLGVLVGLPVYFAAVCFSRLFSRQQSTGAALGMNLVGAMAGGLLEYSSMLIGMRAIWLLALGVYGAALLATWLAGSREAAG